MSKRLYDALKMCFSKRGPFCVSWFLGQMATNSLRRSYKPSRPNQGHADQKRFLARPFCGVK